MKKIIKYFKDFQSQTEFEIVLRRILESSKVQLVNELKYQVLQEGFNGQIEELHVQQSFKILYKHFKSCRNDVASLKILIIIHRLLLSCRDFADHIDLDQVLSYYRQPIQQLPILQQLYQNLIFQYRDYLKGIAERNQYFLLCSGKINDFYQMDFKNQLASQIVIVCLLKKLKLFIPYIENILVKKSNSLIQNLIMLILNDAKNLYEFIAQFCFIKSMWLVKFLLIQIVSWNRLQITPQICQCINLNYWIIKLFQLANLAEIKDKLEFPQIFEINSEQNKEYELYIQLIRNKYEMRSPDSSPKFQDLTQLKKQEEFQIILLKPQQLNTVLGQSERPLEYIESNM
ncbi:unnamed protein product (macronuclear) [Paramecium tetraurelia]|uniref:AP180 N-terminal homology (ANTH) domain-containing protein n=1 Tax=Paramecium tetraurelia TaxID=5888 RepID=A0C5J0_PARTE|nr:uncharacterized protein GSPATT00006556001 [Paramecium tetraurelia]CAK66057.1 unnamed protein product [Paramecium tetraurelia]|eukprot:XP_001433454.1 hypothetical protein (macronuclear) [Paramecium tetraurelia strain d4-2]